MNLHLLLSLACWILGKKNFSFQKSRIIIYFYTTLSFRTEQKGVFTAPQCLIILMKWLSQKLHFIKSFCHCFVEVSSLFLRNLKIQWMWTRSFKERGFSLFKSKYPIYLGYMVTCCWLRCRDATHINKENSPDCQMNWPALRVWEIKCFVWWGESRSGKSGIHECQKQSKLLHIPCLQTAEKQSLPLLPVTLRMASCTVQLGFLLFLYDTQEYFFSWESWVTWHFLGLWIYSVLHIFELFFVLDKLKWRKWVSVHFKCICR